MKKGLLLMVVILPLVHAGKLSEKEWGSVVNKSGKQRMLSQKMAKEFLMIVGGINAGEAKLDATIAEFDTAHKDLLSKAPYDDIKAQLMVVDKLWGNYKTILESKDKKNIGEVYKLSKKVLVQMNKAVGLYEKASMKEGIAGKGKVINVAGRQRMLTQKMSKEALLIKIGHKSGKIQKELKKTRNLFDKSLQALLVGNAKMRIQAPTDDKIKGQLKKVEGLWTPFKGHIDNVASGKTEDATLKSITKDNTKILKEMHKAVGMYE